MTLINLLAVAVSLAVSAAGEAVYTNDFEKAEVGKVPDEIMVLDGSFSVRQVDGNKCLELAGDPIGAFGALFGPGDSAAMVVKARVWADAAGKRFPVFGIGANDAGGYKLMLNPGRRLIELRKGDDTVATAPLQWKPATWTWLRLTVEPQGKDKWLVRGRTWRDGESEPKGWSVTFQDSEAPSPGKASIWGEDYSEKPIRFDDLEVERRT